MKRLIKKEDIMLQEITTVHNVKFEQMQKVPQKDYLHCFGLKFSESNSININFSSILDLTLGLTTS